MARGKRFGSIRGFLGFPALVLLVACGCFAGRVAGANVPNLEPTLSIQVYNYRHAPAHVLVLAERETGEILEKAGLHAVWQDCPAGSPATIPLGSCGKGGRANLVRMIIVAGPKQNVMLDT